MPLTSSDVARLKSLQKDIDIIDRRIADYNEKSAREQTNIARKTSEAHRSTSQTTISRLAREIDACNVRINSNNQQINAQLSSRLRKAQEYNRLLAKQ